MLRIILIRLDEPFPLLNCLSLVGQIVLSKNLCFFFSFSNFFYLGFLFPNSCAWCCKLLKFSNMTVFFSLSRSLHFYCANWYFYIFASFFFKRFSCWFIIVRYYKSCMHTCVYICIGHKHGNSFINNERIFQK